MISFNTNDIFCFIGLKNPENKEVIAIPFIFNENHSKIKTLTDNKIFTVQENKVIHTVKSCLEIEYDAKLYGFSLFKNYTRLNVINEKEIKDYQYAMETYFKNKIKAENYSDFDFLKNDRYRNF